MVEHIKNKDIMLAIIIRTQFSVEGIEFFTPDDFSQQLAYMKRGEGYAIAPHGHNIVPRKIELTQEVLLIKSGKVRVDFYDDDQKYLESYVLYAGDVILLAHGGHGLVMLEESEIIEVKQGPYSSDKDKTRFEGVKTEDIKIKDQ